MQDLEIDVLVVEDGPDDIDPRRSAAARSACARLRIGLNGVGIPNLHFATDAARARSMLNVRDYDVVLLDLDLPNTSGHLAMIDAMARAAHEAPVVILSGKNLSESAVREVIEAGASDLIPKTAHDECLECSIGENTGLWGRLRRRLITSVARSRKVASFNADRRASTLEALRRSSRKLAVLEDFLNTLDILAKTDSFTNTEIVRSDHMWQGFSEHAQR